MSDGLCDSRECGTFNAGWRVAGCDVANAPPEPSPLHCQLIEDWVIAEFSKKKK